MKRVILFFCMFIAVTVVSAQDKPKDIKLSGVKLTERLGQVAKALDDRQKELTDNDSKFQQLLGIYRGFAMAYDSTLAVKDTLTNPKKK